MVFLGGLFHSTFFLKIATNAGGAKEKIKAGKVMAYSTFFHAGAEILCQSEMVIHMLKSISEK